MDHILLIQWSNYAIYHVVVIYHSQKICNFYYPLITKEGEDIPLGKLNYEAKKWLKEVADPRRLREKKSTPSKLFEKEKDHLQSLPPPYLGMIMKFEAIEVKKEKRKKEEKKKKEKNNWEKLAEFIPRGSQPGLV